MLVDSFVSWAPYGQMFHLLLQGTEKTQPFIYILTFTPVALSLSVQENGSFHLHVPFSFPHPYYLTPS